MDLGGVQLDIKLGQIHQAVELSPNAVSKQLRFVGKALCDVAGGSAEVFLQDKAEDIKVSLSEAMFGVRIQPKSFADRESQLFDEPGKSSRPKFDPSSYIGTLKIYKGSDKNWIVMGTITLEDEPWRDLWNDCLQAKKELTDLCMEVAWENMGFLPEQAVWKDGQSVYIEKFSFSFIQRS